MWRLDPDPRFTRDAVERGLFATPFTLLDIGARGGIADHWSVFGERLEVLAVEPAEDEPGLSAYLAGEQGTRLFHHRPWPPTDGFYDTGQLYTGTVIEPIMGIVSSEEVPTTRLVELLGEEQLRRVDFAKLDVEFAELDVLRGAGQLLGSALAIETEVHFPKRPREAGCSAEIDLLLQEHGYELYDLELYRYSRAGLPAPRLYDYRLPDGSRDELGANTEGQPLTGDALYVRTAPPEDADRALKLACILELHRLRDVAFDVLAHAGGAPAGCDPGLLRREPDTLLDRDGNPFGPNFHLHEELWRRRWPEFPGEPPVPLPPRFKDVALAMLRRRLRLGSALESQR